MKRSRSLLAIVGLVGIAGIAYVFFFSTGDRRADSPVETTNREAAAPKEHPPSVETSPLPSRSTAATEPRVDVPAALSVDSPERAGRVNGRVLDPEGAPLAGTRVELFARSAPGADALASGVTDDSGRFRLAVESPSDAEAFSLSIRHRDLLPAIVDGIKLRRGEEVDVGERRLSYGARLSGIVLDPDGAPVPGARVRAEAFMQFTLDDRTRETDAAGAFRIGGLAAGKYDLVADAPGHAPGSLDDVIVEANEELTGLRIVLSRGHAISGRVLGPNGEPIAGATVKRLPGSMGPVPPDRDSPSATTDSSGHFELREVPEGPCRLMARAASFADAEVSASAGDSDVLITLVRPGSIRGRVLDAATGAPLAEFSVWAAASSTDHVWFLGDTANRQPADAQTITGSTDGGFTIASLNPGSYEVHAVAKGCAEGVSPPVVVNPTPEVAEVDVLLSRGGAIHGIVREEGSDRPLSGATVLAFLEKGGPLGGRQDVAFFVTGALPGDSEDLFLQAEASVKTGEDGRFLLEDLASGSYRLKARHPDHAKAEVPGLSVVAGESTGPLTITLGAAGGIEGTVAGTDGAPVSGARIAARTSKGFVKNVTTTDDGHYEMRHLAPGTYYVKRESDSEPQGFAAIAITTRDEPDGDGPPPIKPPGVEVKVRASEMVRLDFSDAELGTISGRVVAEDKPVEGALVELRLAVSFSMPKMARTRIDGRFEFDRLEAGDFRLSVRLDPDPREIVEEKVSVPPGRHVERDLVLPTGSIEGEVLDLLTHRGLEGASIRAEPVTDGAASDPTFAVMIRRGGGSAGLRTDREGKFRIPYLRPGKYRVVAAKDGYGQDSRQPVEIAAAGDRAGGVEIQLGAAGVLAGRVVDAETGAPIANAMVQGRDASGSPLLLAEFIQTDRDGRFRVSSVRPGACTLEVFAPEYQPWRGEAVVNPRGESSTTVTLQKMP